MSRKHEDALIAAGRQIATDRMASLEKIAEAAVACFAVPSTVWCSIQNDGDYARIVALREALEVAGYSWEEYT